MHEQTLVKGLLQKLGIIYTCSNGKKLSYTDLYSNTCLVFRLHFKRFTAQRTGKYVHRESFKSFV